MPNAIRVILWTILSLGMLFIAIMAFWVFLLIIGVVLVARLIYFKLFNKGTVTIHRYQVNVRPSNPTPSDNKTDQNSPYTTVIDADDLDKEYQIPRIK